MSKVVEQMVQEIRTELANGETLEDIKDRSGDFVDSYLPVYTNEIIKEWQEMPSEYDDRGIEELGDIRAEVKITQLMTLDLYLYYTDLFNEAVEKIENELEE